MNDALTFESNVTSEANISAEFLRPKLAASDEFSRIFAELFPV